MSDLEELGFIVQPHTSSGRIPSDKGYRLYVDILLENNKSQLNKSDLLEELVQRADRIENLLQDIAKLLAKETHYATMISTPHYKKSKIKNIQMIALEPGKLLAVVVTDGNSIKNYMIDIQQEIEQTVLNRLTYVLNEHLYGLTLEQINLPLIQSIQKYAEANYEIIAKVLDVVFKAIQSVDDTDIYTSGTTNILKFPEFSGDVSKAMELIDTLEEKDALRSMLYGTTDVQDGQIKIQIGEEIAVAEMKECSLITATYSIGGESGAIGIIGPKRMDYANTISSLKHLIRSMGDRTNKDDAGS